MRRILSIVLAAIALIALQSCEDRIPKDCGVIITTLDATKISLEGYTFNALFEWESYDPVVGEVGVFYSNKPNVTMKNISDNPIYTTPVKKLLSKTLNLNIHQDNFTFSPNKLYKYHAGETVYYRAYLKISTWDPKLPNSIFYYGEEKSFVIPAE